jgi:periplasmic protein TonB
MLTLLSAAIMSALMSDPSAAMGTQTASCASNYQVARIVRPVSPEYPSMAQLIHATGVSRIRVDLSEAGSVVGAWVVTSSGNALLDKAAVSAAKSMIYSPEVRSCSAAPGSYAIEVEFTG